jgi:hypothetical protein
VLPQAALATAALKLFFVGKTAKLQQLPLENVLETGIKVRAKNLLIIIIVIRKLQPPQQHTIAELRNRLVAAQGLLLAQGLTVIPAVRVED